MKVFNAHRALRPYDTDIDEFPNHDLVAHRQQRRSAMARQGRYGGLDGHMGQSRGDNKVRYHT
jgi:hypothetical protein